jgi:hypothetical protein
MSLGQQFIFNNSKQTNHQAMSIIANKENVNSNNFTDEMKTIA